MHALCLAIPSDSKQPQHCISILMATVVTPPPHRPELNPMPPLSQPQHKSPPPAPPQSSQSLRIIKQEPQELSSTTSQPPSNIPQIQQPQPLPLPPPPPPPFISTLTQLRELATSLSEFRRCYDDFEQHLESTRTSINSKLPPNLTPNPLPQPEIAIASLPETQSLDNAVITAPESANMEEQNQKDEKKLPRSELEDICFMMSSRGLRKYLISNMREIDRLREEVPKALKLAPNPAKLVLDCSGRFFLQGSKAYIKNSPMIPGREASILVLELFLLMGIEGLEIDAAVKEEADMAAVAWRKRLINEGGVGKACEADARGLLLFICCFGIPSNFENDDVRDLVRLCNAREISGALRQSSVLVPKIPDMIEGMVKNKMQVEAVDIACSFGLDDRYPPETIILSFVRESKEIWKKSKKAAQGSLAALIEANKKHLADLKSVAKCLDGHKIDPSKLFTGWKISQKILDLEKEISVTDKKIGEQVMPKRKADETDSSKKLKSQEVKRSRLAGHVSEQQRVAAHADARSSYDRLTLLDGGLPSHIPSYSATPSMVYASVAGSLPVSVVGSVPGNSGGLLAAGVGAGMAVSTSGVLPAGSYAGAYGTMVDGSYGHVVDHNTHSRAWFDYATLNERLVGHSLAAEPASARVSGLFRPSSSLEGFAGLPDAPSTCLSSQRSGSDLYQFADIVVESESYHSSGSRLADSVPKVVSAHHSSYLY